MTDEELKDLIRDAARDTTEMRVQDFHPPLCSHCMDPLTWFGIGFGSGWECKGCGIRWDADGTGARLTGESE